MAHGLNAASDLLLCSSQANNGFYNFKTLFKEKHNAHKEEYATNYMWPAKPKMFINWPFSEFATFPPAA